jgi:hypothetical protein
VSVDKDAAKAIIKQQLARRISMSGGPEVFRRMLRGHEELADAAVADLVAEGILKETQLRVGKIYHYPLHAKPSLDYLVEQLQKMKEAPARAARPAAPAHAGRPATPSPVVPAAAAEAAATPGAALATGFTGPIRAQKKSARAGGGAPLPAVEPRAATTAPPAAAVLYTGPVRAQKKSAMAAGAPPAEEVLATHASMPAADALAGTMPAAAMGPPVYTGPVRAKKKSELAAEAAAAGGSGPSASMAAPAPEADAPVASAPEAAPAPPVYTGPIRARKKSEIAAEAAAGAGDDTSEPRAAAEPAAPGAAPEPFHREP